MTKRVAPGVAGILLLVPAAGCLGGTPRLVRDVAGLYAADAEAAAEARLQELSSRTGFWIFLVTGDPPDQPRMLDEPMGMADRRGARAIALLLGPREMVGYGGSRASVTAGDMTRLSSFAVIPNGGRDPTAYLDAVLDELEAWAVAAVTPPPVPAGGEPVGPSGAP